MIVAAVAGDVMYFGFHGMYSADKEHYRAYHVFTVQAGFFGSIFLFGYLVIFTFTRFREAARNKRAPLGFLALLIALGYSLIAFLVPIGIDLQ
jgi:hypothetical protein